MAPRTWISRVRGGEHGRILHRACTVDKSDTEPDKMCSLPVSSRTKFTPWNFVFHIIHTLTLFLKDFCSRCPIYVCFVVNNEKIYCTFYNSLSETFLSLEVACGRRNYMKYFFENLSHKHYAGRLFKILFPL